MNSSQQRDSERAAADSLLEILELQGLGSFALVEKPDERIRSRKAPDWIAHEVIGSAKIAIEVAALQTTPSAGYDSAVWDETFGTIAEELKPIIRENVWLYFPYVSAQSPGLETRAGRRAIKKLLCERLPEAVKRVDDYNSVIDCVIDGIPFPVGIRKRRQKGSVKSSRLVDIPEEFHVGGIAKYLETILPGKLQKFERTEWDGYRRIILLDNRVAFIKEELLQAALNRFANGNRNIFARIHSIYAVVCGNAIPLSTAPRPSRP